MAFGPFDSYAPPGVYTRDRVIGDASSPPTGDRVAVLVGVGQETLAVEDVEIVRGSSASVDQRITNENASPRFVVDDANPDSPVLGPVDGVSARFRVQNYPIVSGNGQGVVTNDPQAVTVTVDGELVAPGSVDGRRGIITLQVPPPAGASVRVTYFFNRTDTLFEDDLSQQVTDGEALLLGAVVEPYAVVAGQNDVLSLRVNGQSLAVVLAPGAAKSAFEVAVEIGAASAAANVALTASVDADNQGQLRVALSSAQSLEILAGSANATLGLSAGTRTQRQRVFYTYQAPIVDGTNGGVVTTDPSRVTVLVNGAQVVPVEVDGVNGAVTLAEPPAAGSTVVVRYYHNTWQDTFDYLPNSGIRRVRRVGYSPGRTDFVEGRDYVIDEAGRIIWGSAVTLASGNHTAGAAFLNDAMTATLVDDKVFLEPAPRFVDRTASPARISDRVVVLSRTPTLGDGTDLSYNAQAANGRPGVSNYRADLIRIYHGANLSEALARGPVTVTGVDPATRRITLKQALPADHIVWATYYYNRLRDDAVTVTVQANGLYALDSATLGAPLLDVRLSASSVPVQWPSNVATDPDAFVEGRAGVNETVTVTFQEIPATPAIFTNGASGPYDIYESASDLLHLSVGSNPSLTVDLSAAGRATLASKGHDPAASFEVVTGQNDTFVLEIDGTAHTASLPAGVAVSADAIVEALNRAVPTMASILGTGTANFDFTGNQAFGFSANGTPVAVTFVAGVPQTIAQVVTAVSAAATAQGLLVGSIASGADLSVSASGQRLLIEAFESLIVTTGNSVLGIAVQSLANATVASYTDALGQGPLRFVLRSRTLPSGPSDVSRVRVLGGTANALLGFAAFQSAEGAESAVNKPATLLGRAIAASDITQINASGGTLGLAINGVEFSVSFDGVTVASASDIAAEIDAAIASQGMAEAEGNRIRITSNTPTASSLILVRGGTAVLRTGFASGDRAAQRRATASDLAAVLNTHGAWPQASGFQEEAFADVVVSGASSFLRLTTWAAQADIAFLDGADSALNDTGLGIAAGDGASGAPAQEGFDVSSNAPSGSSGQGVVGQTYVDARTGLRFTVLPSEAGYASGEFLELVVSQSFAAGLRPVRAIPGVRLVVADTLGVPAGDTALVRAYDKSGAEPSIGDFYYISYDYEKDDFSTRLFTRFRDIQANYGRLSPENPLTLAAFLAIQNGAVLVGCKQVLKQPGFNQASAAAYIQALEDLSRPLPGGVLPDILVPLTTDVDVMGAYALHAERQSSPRLRQERRCVFGVASGTRPDDAKTIARALSSERAILVYPDSAIVSLEDELGNEVPSIVDGTYIAAAMAGSLTSPAFDVAEPLTRRRLTGFRRLNRTMDEVEKNQLAVAGVSILEDRGGVLQVRDGLTTNMASRFTSTPSIVAIRDFVNRQTRATLDRFIGLKFITSRAQDVEIALTGLLNGLVEQQIIAGFRGVRAEPDPDDPTMLRVSAFYAPVFPLKYIAVTYTIGSSANL